MDSLDEPTAIEVECSGGKIALVDESDYEFISRFNWSGGEYPTTSIKRGGNYGRSVAMAMHRLLMKPSKGMVVDHINGDKYDNRRANLRICTQTENMWNKGPQVDKYKGVSVEAWVSDNRPPPDDPEIAALKWNARIRHNGKVHFLGRFKSPIEAAKAYDSAAMELNGEFARLNFPRHPNAITPVPVRLPQPLHDWVKKYARKNGQTISGFMRVLLEKQKHDEEQAKRIEKIKQVEA